MEDELRMIKLVFAVFRKDIFTHLDTNNLELTSNLNVNSINLEQKLLKITEESYSKKEEPVILEKVKTDFP